MKRNVVLVSEVPEPPYPSHLVCIPTAAVPFTLSALVLKSQKYWYASPDDWQRGRRLLAQLGKALLMDCAQPIVDAIDRVYNLLDAGLNGTERTATGLGTYLDPFVYDPPIPQTIAPTEYEAPGARHYGHAVAKLVDNLVTGTTSDIAPGVAVPNGKLQEIIDLLVAMGEESQVTPEQIEQIILILGAV